MRLKIEKYGDLSKIDKKLLDEYTENRMKKRLGIKPVGKAWVSEASLFKIVKRIYRPKKVIHHYRPNWLERLELDIFVPALSLAIEYQGQQHYKAISHWGGEAALVKTKARDLKKKKLCNKNKVVLVFFKYTEILTEQTVRSKLDMAMAKQNQKNN